MFSLTFLLTIVPRPLERSLFRLAGQFFVEILVEVGVARGVICARGLNDRQDGIAIFLAHVLAALFQEIALHFGAQLLEARLIVAACLNGTIHPSFALFVKLRATFCKIVDWFIHVFFRNFVWSGAFTKKNKLIYLLFKWL